MSCHIRTELYFTQTTVLKEMLKVKKNDENMSS